VFVLVAGAIFMIFNKVELVVWIIALLTMVALYIARYAKTERREKINEGNKLYLSLLLCGVVFGIEQASKVGWVPGGRAIENIVGVGYITSSGLSIFFAYRMLR